FSLAVLLDHRRKAVLEPFVGRKAPLAVFTLAAPPRDRTLRDQARIDDPAVRLIAVGALHDSPVSRRRRGRAQPSKAESTSATLVPPNPNELLMTCLSERSRARCGT